MMKSGQWEMALSLFEELCSNSDSSLMPDLYTYNTVMTVYSRSGMLDRALGLLEETKARGLRPDVVTYRCGAPWHHRLRVDRQIQFHGGH